MGYNKHMQTKTSRKILRLLSIFCAFTLVFSIVPKVQAEELTLTEEQKGAISQNCESLRSTLNNLRRVDSRTRSFLGGAYTKLLDDYISPMNVRMVANEHPSPNLISIHSDILNSQKVFAASFTSYSQSFEQLLNIDCKERPEDFYRQLVATRRKRTMLESTTTSLRTALHNCYTAVEKMKAEL